MWGIFFFCRRCRGFYFILYRYDSHLYYTHIKLLIPQDNEKPYGKLNKLSFILEPIDL